MEARGVENQVIAFLKRRWVLLSCAVVLLSYSAMKFFQHSDRPMNEEPRYIPHPNVSQKQQIKAFYGELYVATEALFFRHDPIGINFEDNTDEYDPEVATVLPRLRSCSSVADVQRVVHEEFTRWFGDAGPLERYAPIATELWQLWNDFKSKTRRD